MHAEWDLSDGTRVEAKLVDLGKWSVRVNGADVASTTTRASFFENDTSFRLPDGREALMSIRKALHGAEIDLHIDGRAILYPGRRPFRCPACRIATRPDELTCSSCEAALPDRAHRLQKRRLRRLAWNLVTNPLFSLGLVLVGTITTVRDPSVAAGQLQLVHGDRPAYELSEMAVSRAWNTLPISVVVVLAFMAIALLSRRAPMVAAAGNFAFWLGTLVMYPFDMATPSVFVLGFLVIFAASAWRGLRLALEIRAAEAAFRQPPSS